VLQCALQCVAVCVALDVLSHICNSPICFDFFCLLFFLSLSLFPFLFLSLSVSCRLFWLQRVLQCVL